MKPKPHPETVIVSADGDGLLSHAGTVLLVETADRTGLTAAPSEAMALTRQRVSAHDPCRVLRDVAVVLADGGDCVSDIGQLVGQQSLLGPAASETTTQRTIKSVDETARARVRRARAAARARAWDAGARPAGLTLDIDATLVSLHSEKDRVAGNYKHGFGFYPARVLAGRNRRAACSRLAPGERGVEHLR